MGLPRDQAEELLGTYAEGLWKSVVDLGFERYKNTRYRSTHRRATVASVIHDLIVDGARTTFDGNAGIRFIEVHGTDITLMEIEETALIWLKKLDGQRRACGPNRTRGARRLLRGDSSELPNVRPSATVLIVGYLTNQAQTAVSRVSIVRPSPSGMRAEWYLDLTAPQSGLIVMGGRSPEQDEDSGVKTKITIIRGDQQSKLIN